MFKKLVFKLFSNVYISFPFDAASCMDCHWYRNSLYSHFLYWNKGTSRTPSKKDQHTHGSSGMKQYKISIALSSTSSHLSQLLAMDDSQPRFLSQGSVVVTLLRYCFGWLQHCFIATLAVLRWKSLLRILPVITSPLIRYYMDFSCKLWRWCSSKVCLICMYQHKERIISLNSHWFSWELKPWFAVFVHRLH